MNLISNNDNNAHYISLQSSTPDIDPTHDNEGADPTHEKGRNPTHDEGLDVHHSDTGTYSISIEK